MDAHQVVNSIAAFSFLTSSVFILMVKIPRLPQCSRLRMCRVFLSLAFGVVGLSCLKTVLCFVNYCNRNAMMVNNGNSTYSGNILYTIEGIIPVPVLLAVIGVL